ncbi:MAG: DUF4352 domain-containing protein, partial [Chloroflexota bacterium]
AKFIESGLVAPAQPPTVKVETVGRPPATGRLGESTQGHGCSLSASVVEDPAKPGILYKPKEGTKLIAVEITIANDANEVLDVNPLYATLVDAQGFVYRLELAGRDGQLQTVKLSKGEKAKGWVAFEVPKTAAVHSLKYQTDIVRGNYLRVGLTK